MHYIVNKFMIKTAKLLILISSILSMYPTKALIKLKSMRDCFSGDYCGVVDLICDN